MKVLELFAGTRSISKAFESRMHECFTIELDTQHEDISLYADILTITAKDIIEKFGKPDVIWASPPCTSYSIAAISHHRTREYDGHLSPKSDYAKLSDELVKHVIELIQELDPKYWFIENPRGGLRKMRFMRMLQRYTVTYCQYNDPLIQELIFNMQNKKCPQCGEIKDIGEFYSNKSRRDGFSTYCKQCIKVQSHDYNQKHKEEGKQRLNKWRAANREYVRERDKKYKEEHPEIETKKQKKYRENHKEKLFLKGKKYRTKNMEYFLNKSRERKLSLKNVSDGTVTLEIEKNLYEKQNHKCSYCCCDLDKTGKHLDHIIPISRGGKHTANNIHWVCPKCNMSKGNKTEDEWLKKERMKPTDLFTNHGNPRFKPMCKNGDPCHEAAPRGSKTGTQGLKNAKDRSVIPKGLCDHIVAICEE